LSRLAPQDPDGEPEEVLLRRMHGDSKDVTFEKGNLPKGWVETKIGHVSELIGGGTPSRKNHEYFDGNIIWLTPTEIPKDQIVKINDSRERITKLGLEKSSAKTIPEDSVLLTSRASIGYVAIAGTSVTTNQGFASFVCNKAMYNYFLAYWLVGNRGMLESQATGTTFKEISKSKLRELLIPLPPFAEQRRIVSKIESILARIDACRQKLLDLQGRAQSGQASLAALRGSVLKQAFEGRLVPQDPDDEPAEVLLRRMHRDSKDVTFEKEDLPSGWAKIELNDYVYIAARIGWRGLKKSEYTTEGPFLLAVKDIHEDGSINYKNVTDHLSKFRYEESAEIKLQKHDILVTKDGTIGKIGYVDVLPQPTTVNSSILVVRPDKSIFSRYLFYYFRSPFFQKIIKEKIKGISIPHLFQYDIKRFQLRIPPLNEQKRIVSKIESILSGIDAKQKELQILEERLKSVPDSFCMLRSSILKQAFEGRLVPQDPNDEPASVLLEKLSSKQSQKT